MIKNAVIISDLPNVDGGAVAVAVDTAYLLAQKGLNVYFFSGEGTPDTRLTASSKIKIISTGQKHILYDKNRFRAFANGIYSLRAARALKDLLATLDAEQTVVNVHSWTRVLSPSVFKAAIDMGFRVFVTIHDYLMVCPTGNLYDYQKHNICEITPMSLKCFLCNCDKRHYYHKIHRLLRQYVQNRIIRNAAENGKIGYIFISEFSKRQLLRRLPAPRNQFFIRNPIYFTDRFRAEAENNSAFLFIGRADPEKGIVPFCEAVHNSGVNGVVIGDGALRVELEAKYPEITFTGWLDKPQIREWLKRARCLVASSVCYEVSPLVPPEVSAYGIPVIAPSWSAASDNASFVYHSQQEFEDIMRKVNAMDIRKLSEEIYRNFDESVTTNYADNLMKIYESPLK